MGINPRLVTIGGVPMCDPFGVDHQVGFIMRCVWVCNEKRCAPDKIYTRTSAHAHTDFSVGLVHIGDFVPTPL